MFLSEILEAPLQVWKLLFVGLLFSGDLSDHSVPPNSTNSFYLGLIPGGLDTLHPVPYFSALIGSQNTKVDLTIDPSHNDNDIFSGGNYDQK
jgi:hypothetical protein